MTDSLGARLRRRREEQGIDLIAIAAQTKIKLSLLEALERDDVSHWPSGIFRRAYIKTYGHAIGLDPDVLVREFLEVHPEPGEVVTTEAIASALDGSGRNSAPPTRLRYIVGSAIDSLSRLRRSAAVENLVVADGGWVNVPAPAEPMAPAAPAGPAGRRAVVVSPPEPAPPETNSDLFAGDDLAAPGFTAPERDTGVEEPAVDAGREEPKRPATVASVPRDVAVPAPSPVSPPPDFLGLARLCTEFGRVQTSDEVQLLLREAATIIDATGIIVWVWDAQADGLRAALAHGYSDKLIAQLPTVSPDADNATATAFRSGRTCAIQGRDHASGALAIPLLTPDGCQGVFAVELSPGTTDDSFARASATIVAAFVAQLVWRSQSADVPAGADEEGLRVQG